MASAAGPWFRALPSRCAPVSRAIDVPAMRVPFMVDSVPRVTVLPAVQNTFCARAAPRVGTAAARGAVVLRCIAAGRRQGEPGEEEDQSCESFYCCCFGPRPGREARGAAEFELPGCTHSPTEPAVGQSFCGSGAPTPTPQARTGPHDASVVVSNGCRVSGRREASVHPSECMPRLGPRQAKWKT